jgi:predicted nucleotidyltransferase
MDRAETVERLRAFFDTDPHGASAVYLFGSVSRGTAGRSSDVDVAVLWPADPPSVLDGPAEALAANLERLLRTPVEVVSLNGAPVDLVHRVLRDGVLLLERDPGARIRFEVQARNEYFDLLPFLRRYRGSDPVARREAR